ncbi:MAG: hypothetical protein EOO42_03800, partial [Flavobacteriales bacterium]
MTLNNGYDFLLICLKSIRLKHSINKTNIKTILFLCSLFYASTSFAQITVYIAPNGKVLTEETYQNGKITSLANARKNHGADYQLFEKLELVNKNGDSVKYKFRWEFMNKEMLAEKQIMGKLIGTQLSIKNLNFIDKSTQTKINYGKPTFINFWFTNCIPCIEELPHFEKVNKEKEVKERKIKNNKHLSRVKIKSAAETPNGPSNSP